MKHQWLAYVTVILLAIGAGVAIAGLPNSASVATTITTSPSGTEAIESTATTEVLTDDTAPADTTTPDTTTPDTTTPETTIPDTTVAVTTEPDVPETSEPEALPDRAEIVVAVANGAGVAGAAARNVERLIGFGYEDVTAHDGTEIVEFTTIYFADGFEAAAARLAEDLELLPIFVIPLAEAPEVIDLPDDTELLAYIGVDRAD